MIDPVLRAMYAAAYAAALRPPVLPAAELPARVRLDDTGRPPIVPLRPVQR